MGMLSRRQFIQTSIATGAVIGLDRLYGPAAMAENPKLQMPLTPFKDPLRLPPVLRPQEMRDGLSSLMIRLRAGSQRIHSELPPTPFWGYEGCLPGPMIEVQRGQRVRVEYVNDLPADGGFPVTAVMAPKGPQQNRPGREGRPVDANVAALKPWIVTHLHGGRTAAGSDGWTEDAVFTGQSTVCNYDNDQAATMLWYHDHALGITRYNVYAGLAGAYIIRDPEEAALKLPTGKYEIPLIIQDRNLDTAPDGTLTGRLLHKVTDDTMEFFGPFTTVNGTIWPYAEVEARQYRLRVLNASNSRTYRLVLLDESGANVLDRVTQIGTDGGLLDTPVSPPSDGLILASAERADLIIDFRALAGQQLTMVNTAAAPFKGLAFDKKPGTPDAEQRIPYPQVIEFRVSPQNVDDPFAMPKRLSNFHRMNADALAAASVHRMVALMKHEVDGHDMFMLHELMPSTGPATGEPLLAVQDEGGVVTSYRTAAHRFEDTVNFMVTEGSTEVWHFLNLTKSMHPMHLHLVQFQAIARHLYDVSGFDGKFATKSPVRFKKRLELAANELGPKDTIRVNPGELVSIAMTFQGFTGRYMYHCHMLEHEDMDMMRPFVVVPSAAMEAMGMGPMKMDHDMSKHAHD
jgi:FtsP/CotA-like multicopper oxidase with cupredoxin domain